VAKMEKRLPSAKPTQPLKMGLPKRKVVFRPSIFRGYVRFREGISTSHGNGYRFAAFTSTFSSWIYGQLLWSNTDDNSLS